MQSEGIHVELKVLHDGGWSISALARESGLDWRTVKREVTSDAPRHYPERAKPSTLSDAHLAHVERRLTICPVLRGSDLWAELCRDYAYTGSYRSFLRHIAAVRPVPEHEPEVRFETDPGVQVQMDWAHWRRATSVTALSEMLFRPVSAALMKPHVSSEPLSCARLSPCCCRIVRICFPT